MFSKIVPNGIFKCVFCTSAIFLSIANEGVYQLFVGVSV
jgi:hypothetical protein